MYHSIRRGLKRKEPGQDPELGDYQAGVNQFQAAVRKRESMRLKLQMNSVPGILEKELMNKMKVEDSVCQVCGITVAEHHSVQLCHCVRVSPSS